MKIEKVKFRIDVADWSSGHEDMKGEAEHGLEHHFEVQGMNNGEVTIT